MAKAGKKNILDKLADILSSSEKVLRGRMTTSGAVVAALFGGVLKLTEVTKTFPAPADLFGNVIIFIAVLIIVTDICRGGLFD